MEKLAAVCVPGGLTLMALWAYHGTSYYLLHAAVGIGIIGVTIMTISAIRS